MSAPSTLTTRGARGRSPGSGPTALARGLGWFSIGLGLVETLAPAAVCRVTGLRGRTKLVRAYGLRELASGVAILGSHDPTPWIWGRIGGDAMDFATLVADLDSDNPRRGKVIAALAVASGVALLDALCVQEFHESKRLSPKGQYEHYRARTGFPRPASAMSGAAADFAVPSDFRIPEALRPWTTDKAPGA
ncbi:MAG: hypothetical protein ACRYGP_19940 [Janthinobacterium lividum]